ncbi:MAG: tripartite tricarboxylate transporter substrate binding protein [Spirochaetes bacterium]|nr:tripartite tricarboxylate transporter substrate binding protein [Spirochaetota bacterium]
MVKRSFLIIIGLFVASGILFCAGKKETTGIDWPKKAIQVIVPYNPGGDTDFNARAYAKYLEKELGQPVVIVNVAGVGGTLGSRKAKDATPDGYTVLFYHTAMIVNQVTEMVPYGVEDFELSCIAAMSPGNVIAINAKSPWKSLKELVDDSIKRPGEIKFAADIGGTTYVLAMQFLDAGAKFNVVDAGSSTARNAALKGGQIDVVPNPYGPTKPFLQSGDFRALGVTNEKRHPRFPEIPTCKEQGYDVALEIYYFFAFPKGTPIPIVEKLSTAVKNICTTNQEYAQDIAKAYDQVPFYLGRDEGITLLAKQKEQIGKYKDKLKAK